MNGIIDQVVLNNLQRTEELERRRVRRIHYFRDDAYERPDHEFVKFFRITKEMALNLIETLRPYIRAASRTSAIDVETKVLVALRFFATGSYQLDIGSNIYLAVSQPTVSRCLHQVLDAMNQPNIMNQWVSFPSTIEELKHLRQRFYEKFDFPGLFGCVDGTFVSIFPPHIEDDEYPENIYVSRRGSHAINVQLVCDYRMKILNVNARHPGATNDVYIFNNSNVSTYLIRLHEHGHFGFSLLGDSGYSLRTYMLTPITNPAPDSPEARYNRRHMRARSIIERCNGLLKMRFRCLSKHRVLYYAPETASQIINACVILHNMCIKNNMTNSDPEEDDDEADFETLDNETPDVANRSTNRRNPNLAAGIAHRNRIIMNYFNY